jgi:Tfp pilus assembly protein PilW
LNRLIQGISLVELIIAIILLSIIILTVTNIQVFSKYHLFTSDRRVKLQNEASLGLEHMTKQVARAIGNEIIAGNNSVVDIGSIGGESSIRVFIDSNGDGQRDTVNDLWIAYRFIINSPPSKKFQIWYCPSCENNPCTRCTPSWGTEENIVSRNIQSFTVSKPSSPLQQNYVTLELRSCWDPSTATLPNGTPDNPCINMSTRIIMPSVSVN